MSDLSDHYMMMMRGGRPDDCLCHLIRLAHLGPDPQPAEWEQGDDCPIHPLKKGDTDE